MVVGDAYVFSGFLTPVLTQLFFPKPPTMFLTCFCRGERWKYARKKIRLNRVSNLQPPGHESDTLTTEPSGWGYIFERTIAIFFFFFFFFWGGVAFREEFTRTSFYVRIVKIAPIQLMPCLLMDQNFSNNFWKGSTKKHFYEIISKSDQWFQRRFF